MTVKHYLRLTCKLRSRSFHLMMSLAIVASICIQFWIQVSSTLFLREVAQADQIEQAGYFDRYQIGLALYQVVTTTSHSFFAVKYWMLCRVIENVQRANRGEPLVEDKIGGGTVLSFVGQIVLILGGFVCYVGVLLQVDPTFYVDHYDREYWLVLGATLLLYAPNFTVLLWIGPALKKLRQADNMTISKHEVLLQSTTYVAAACADLLVVFELLFYP